MPKSAIKPQPVPEPPILSRNTRKAIDGLKDFYRLGLSARQSTDAAHGRSAYGDYALQTFADSSGMGKSIAYEARNFAMFYSQEEFDELIELCTTLNVPLACSHVIELMRVSQPHLRKQLQESAAKGRWSVRRLREEVKLVRAKA